MPPDPERIRLATEALARARADAWARGDRPQPSAGQRQPSSADPERTQPTPDTPVSSTWSPRPRRDDPELLNAALDALRAALAEVRDSELDRGVCLAGPHRDELELAVRGLPARGYASHGESWSLALALRLASFDLLRAGREDPVLILDDVFAELDIGRRNRLAALVADAEQVLVTAAVPADVPSLLAGMRFSVSGGELSRAS